MAGTRGSAPARWRVGAERAESVPATVPALGLLGLATLACLLPFIDKAFHIDDPLYIWGARQITRRPLDFYGFDVNWFGQLLPMFQNTQNPPGFSYWLAMTGLAVGWGERAMHASVALIALATVLGVYQLGRQLTARPGLAAACALLTPVFLVSSPLVMCDLPMVCLWVWAVHLWIAGERSDDRRKLWLAALLAAASALTKYYGIALIPLLLMYSVARRGRPSRNLLPLLLPLILLLAYEALMRSLYGGSHLSYSASFSLAPRTDVGVLGRCVRGTVFAGGCLASVLALAPWIARPRTLAAWLAGAGAAFLALAVEGGLAQVVWRDAAGWRWGPLLSATLFLVAGAAVLAIAVDDLRRGVTAESLLIVAWLLGTLVFATFVNWSLTGRSILPMAPALGLLVARRVTAAGRPRGLWLGLAAAGALSLAPAWADYRHADSARGMAARIVQRYGQRDGTVWFQGHWGFQYYMEAAGAKALNLARYRLHPGDVVVMPLNNSNVRPLYSSSFGATEVMRDRPTRWVSCMDLRLGAGFHTAVWGPLPFSIGPTTPEEYDILPVLARR
jgi:4-amino-4-deoxy-L-arabinose transferase-like glycosyltransferase